MGLFDGDTWKNPLTWIPPVAVANAAYSVGGGKGDIVGGIGDALGDAKEGRTSNWTSHDFGDNRNYDPNAFQYGGYKGGANDYTQQAYDEQGREQAIDDYYRQQGEQGQNRWMGEDANLVGQDQESRGQQTNATDLARQAAEGKAPSAAQYMMQQGMDQATAQQNGQAAGARGAASIALAQGNANANIANMQQQNSVAAGRMRADEMATARNQYGQMAAQQRGQDQSRLGQSNQNNQFNRQANDAYQLGMGNLAQGRSQSAQGYYNTGVGVQNSQSGAQQQQQGLLAGSDSNTQNANAGVNMANTQANAGFQKELIGMGGSLLSSGAGMAGGK